jgi:hypothetical protein
MPENGAIHPTTVYFELAGAFQGFLLFGLLLKAPASFRLKSRLLAALLLALSQHLLWTALHDSHSLAYVPLPVLHFLLYMIPVAVLLRKHRQALKDYFSDIERVKLDWLQRPIGAFGALLLIFIAGNVVDNLQLAGSAFTDEKPNMCPFCV